MDQHGFVKLSNILTHEESQQIIKWADQLNQIEETAGKWMIYFESNGNRSRIENFISFMSNIKKFVESKLQPLLEKIISKKVSIFKDKMNWKHGKGKGFAPHQDHPAWTDFPPSKFYTIAIFADDTTIENGCLEFAEDKNSELLPYNKSGNGGLKNADTFDWKPVTTTTRDVLIFDSYAPHRSGDNKTNGSRRIFYFTFNPSDDGSFYDEYLTKKREAFPPRIERDDDTVYGALNNKYNLANPFKGQGKK
jgi:2-aminoethylphosphonate dioxygenase